MPVILTAVTLIECDGIEESRCPSTLELPYTQGVAIRLARQSGWTIWLETHCPECSTVPSHPAGPAPAVPTSLKQWDTAAMPETRGMVLLSA